MRVSGAILATAAVVALTASCATAAAGTPSGSARTVEIEMKEFSFSPSTIRLKAGERVVLRVKNSGTMEHDLMAGREAEPSEGYHEDLFKEMDVRMTGGTAASDHGHAGGLGLLLPSGRSGAAAFTVTASPGQYEFGCFVVGHYEVGMKGALIIE